MTRGVLVDAGVKVSIDVGDEVWMLVSEPAGKERHRLIGAARARVLAVPSLTEQRHRPIDLEILSASPAYLVGRKLSQLRSGLYLIADLGERRAFVAEVERFWGLPF